MKIHFLTMTLIKRDTHYAHVTESQEVVQEFEIDLGIICAYQAGSVGIVIFISVPCSTVLWISTLPPSSVT